MALDIVDQVRAASEGKKVMVTLDSSHSAHHVADEMEVYCLMVSVGSYCIVEVRDFLSAVSPPPAGCTHVPPPKNVLRLIMDLGFSVLVRTQSYRGGIPRGPSRPSNHSSPSTQSSR